MTRKQMLKELEGILLNLDRAVRKAERISGKIDVPSFTELFFIRSQVAELIELGKEK